MGDVLSNKKILVVDDEVHVGELLKEGLEMAGAQVCSVTSAQDAIDYLDNKETDLIISDIRMPKGSGVLILDHINEKHIDLPIVFITGFSSYFREDLIGKGAVDVLPKPIKASALVKLSKEILDKAN